MGVAQTHLLGWKAMPFALDDLDSNCAVLEVSSQKNNYSVGAWNDVPWSTFPVRTAFWRGGEAVASSIKGWNNMKPT